MNTKLINAEGELMGLEIAEAVLNSTSKCTKSYDCINNEAHALCKVEHCVNSEVYFIKCLLVDRCDYQIPFGSSHFCSCPVRKEIYNKYGK